MKNPLHGKRNYPCKNGLCDWRSHHWVDTASGSTDIFSFGVTAFELLTGRKAFGSGTTQEMFNRAKIGSDFENPPSVLDFTRKVSAKLDRIIHGCLAKNLKERYPVMSLVVRDLQALT